MNFEKAQVHLAASLREGANLRLKVADYFPVWYSNDGIFVGEYDCLLDNQRTSSGLEQEQAPVPASLP